MIFITMPDDTKDTQNTDPTERESAKDPGLVIPKTPSAPPVGGSNDSKTPDTKPTAPRPAPPADAESGGQADNEPLSDPLANAYEYDEKPKPQPVKQEETTIKPAPIPEKMPEKDRAPKPPETQEAKTAVEPVPEVTDTLGLAPASAKIKPSPAQEKSPAQTIGPKAVIKRGGGRAFKIITWIIVVLAALGVAFYLFFYRATLVINPTPTPDEITLDGKKINPGTYRVNPGRHKLSIKKAGYVSYVIDRKFTMAQKEKLDFAFEKQLKGTAISANGSNITLSSNKDFIVFIGNDGKLYSHKLEDKATPQAISTASYQNVRELLVSKDNKFALILDDNGLKIVDFMRGDLVNQTETKLPPLASAIHSVTWNSLGNGGYPEANSHIIYDIKTDYGWDLILANRQHSQSEILMQIDEQRFKDINLDWSNSQKQVLIAGGELGIIDLATRSYAEVLKDKNIVSAKWSPQAVRFAGRSKDGKIYGSEDQTAIDLGIEGDLYRFASDSELFVVSDGRIMLYNFDTEQVINYAEIDGLKDCQSFEVVDQTIYFAGSEGIKSAVLQLPKY